MAAGPRWSAGGAASPRAVFVVIDNSPSMAYVEVGESRLGRAVRFARAFAAGASDEDVGAVTWSGGGDTEGVWGSLAEVARGLEVPPASPGGLADALAAARDAFAAPAVAGREKEIAVFTDMQAVAFTSLGAAAVVPPGVDVTIYDVRAEAGPMWNVALTGVRATPDGPGSFEVALDVEQYGRPRPVALEEESAGEVGEAPAVARATVRLRLGGGRYVFRAAGGYPFDDRLELELPPSAATSYYVEPTTGAARAWAAAWDAVGATPAPDGATFVPPGIWVLPLSAWTKTPAARSFVDAGGVAVVVPESEAGRRFDAETKLAAFSRVPGEVRMAAGVLPRGAAAGPFAVAGTMAVVSAGRWATVAATADGRPFLISRRLGPGEVYLMTTPLSSGYTNFTTTPAFVAFAAALRARALALRYPAFEPYRRFVSSESSPGKISGDKLSKLYPGAVVTRRPPGGTTRRSFALGALAAAAALMLMAGEVVLASSAFLGGGGRCSG